MTPATSSRFARFFLGLALTFAAPARAQIEQARPWLGVAIDAGKAGVLVKDVISGTPAEQYGLKAGDEILSVQGTKVTKPEELIAAVRAQGVGNSVKIEFVRAGKTEAKDVKLVARPDDLELVRKKVMGKEAPAFKFETVSGNDPNSNTALKGKVTVMEFWATWCPACRSTHPRLSAWAGMHKGTQVVAISDEELPEIKEYAKEHKPVFTILRDKDHVLTKEWMITAIPMIVVLDKKGVVQFATIGAGSYLDEALAAAEKLEAAH